MNTITLNKPIIIPEKYLNLRIKGLEIEYFVEMLNIMDGEEPIDEYAPISGYLFYSGYYPIHYDFYPDDGKYIIIFKTEEDFFKYKNANTYEEMDELLKPDEDIYDELKAQKYNEYYLTYEGESIEVPDNLFNKVLDWKDRKELSDLTNLYFKISDKVIGKTNDINKIVDYLFATNSNINEATFNCSNGNVIIN